MTELLDRVVARALGAPRRRGTYARDVYLEQRGTIRLKAGSRWSSFTATQWIDAHQIAFRWDARIKMAPLVTVRVVDELEAGCGSLDATLWRFLHLARARGPDCDVGQAMRYLAELPWCPMAYVDHDDSLSFADVAEDRLRVTYDDRSDVWVDLHVDPAGDVIGISTDGRPRMEGKRTVLRPWSGVFADHAEQAGVRVPRKGAVTWHLPDGPFETWRGEITSYRVDQPRARY